MSTQADKLRDILRRKMEESDLTPNGWASKAGMPESTLRNFLAGRSDTLTYSTLISLSGAVGLKVSDLLNETIGTVGDDRDVYVTYQSDAEAWKEAYTIEKGLSEEEKQNWFKLRLPSDPRYGSVLRWGVLISDDSFDDVYPPGTIAIFIKYNEFVRRVESGDRVLCQEYRWTRDANGNPAEEDKSKELVRTSVREFQVDGDDGWFILRSRSPRWQRPIRVKNINQEDRLVPQRRLRTADQSAFYIRGVIVGSYQLE